MVCVSSCKWQSRVWKMVGDKVVCEWWRLTTWCVPDCVWQSFCQAKMWQSCVWQVVCEKNVCERRCVTELCVKGGVWSGCVWSRCVWKVVCDKGCGDKGLCVQKLGLKHIVLHSSGWQMSCDEVMCDRCCVMKWCLAKMWQSSFWQVVWDSVWQSCGFETIRNSQPLLWAKEKKWNSSLSNTAAMENEQKLVVKLSTSWDAAPFSSFKDSAYFLQFPWGKNTKQSATKGWKWVQWMSWSSTWCSCLCPGKTMSDKWTKLHVTKLWVKDGVWQNCVWVMAREKVVCVPDCVCVWQMVCGRWHVMRVLQTCVW